MFRTLVIATASLLALVSSAFAEPASVKVYYGDLNLQSYSGANTLYTRLRSAVRRVCPYDSRQLFLNRGTQTCRRETLAWAVKQLDVPFLTEIHEVRRY